MALLVKHRFHGESIDWQSWQLPVGPVIG